MTLPLNSQELTAMVDAELKDIINARDVPLYGMMSYHMGWSDAPGHTDPATPKRHNLGQLCLLACSAVGGKLETAVPGAASVELVHNFTEIHDDVQSGVPGRANRDALWWVWGPAQAINAGDGMHALARLALFRLLEQGVSPEVTFHAVRLMDEASLATCEGRFMDMEAQERLELSLDSYLKMAALKNGSLLAGALKLGALIGSGSESLLDPFQECGTNLGVALQVQADVSEFWSASPSPEVMNKKKLVPIVFAMEKASAGEKRRLGEVYFKRVLDGNDVTKVQEIVEGLGVKEACQDIVSQHVSNGMSALDKPGISSDGKASIEMLVKQLLGG
ncbi:MAG: polyprenyl synthetase family protein [Chloroflexi bacterium]|nr:polyprenyl synthetase family protein [Chloroflexota bacterium]MDA1228619.1 polyprenyl synthetase family protein [Chloroflexota bacterium]